MTAAPTWTIPSDAAIEAILAERIDIQRDGVGIVIGVIDQTGRRTVAHGRFKRGGRRKVGHDTVFEIGSITKVFTSLLLSDMALRGEVALDDHVAKLLPEGVAMPQWGERAITLADLATHMSGLPRLPTNAAPADRDNPNADYTIERLYAFLNAYRPTRDIGDQYEYSNLGYGLLGHVLARRLATDYESLVKTRITGPLGMNDTAMRLSPHQLRRLAQGHDPERRPVPNWDHSEGAAGAGGLRSTADDLLTLLAVALGYQAAPLRAAIDAQLAYPMHQTGQQELSTGLGWAAMGSGHRLVVGKAGGTPGYRTFMGLDPTRGWGAVALANTFTTRGADDICRHILTGAPVEPAQQAIAIKPSVLDRYVGHYRYATGASIEIRRSEDGLAASLNGQIAAPIFPSSPTHFFWRTVDAELTFETDASGRAVALVTRSRVRGENRAVRE